MFDEKGDVGDVDELMAWLDGIDEGLRSDGHQGCCVDHAHSYRVLGRRKLQVRSHNESRSSALWVSKSKCERSVSEHQKIYVWSPH